MPPVCLLIGEKGFANYYLPVARTVREALAANPHLSLSEAQKIGPVIAWGNFLTIVINFIILAFIIFLMVKAINSAKRKQAVQEHVEPAPPAQEVLLAEIRDLLKK